MITVWKAAERRRVRGRGWETWATFSSPNKADSTPGGFGALEVFDEHRLEPGAIIPRHPNHAAEMVTYVRDGALATKDSAGPLGLVHSSEFQRVIGRRGVGHRATKASPADATHVFQMGLRHSLASVEPSHSQKRVSTAKRRGRLCVVASPDGKHDSLHLHEDVVICSAMYDAGQHVVHELAPGRCAWLHIVLGQAALGDISMTTGDGAAFSNEPAVSLTAGDETEILLLDLREEALG